MLNMIDLIIGKGEVGCSLYRVLKKHHPIRIRDREPLATNAKIRYLHICFPFSKNFIRYVKDYIEEYNPKITVIHSTVPMGTTRQCGENAVHSPVRGTHPNLDKGLKTFIKYIGGKERREVANYFRKARIKTKAYKTPETTELLKILSTTYYAWNIIFCKEVKKICDKYGLNFDEVYTHPNKTYNNGYKKLGKGNVVRPILKSTKGKIGGHCIIPNCHLLNAKITKIILKFNKNYK